MTSFFKNLNVSSMSFLLILFVGILVVYILYRLRKYFPESIKTLSSQLTGVRVGFTVNSEVRFRNDVYHYAQKQHLAASLFSLDEVAIVPKVLTPLIQTSQSIELAPTDSVSLIVPYLPDWPELGAIYKASTMSLIDALQGGANIMLAGQPGSGKTVALAWLASAMVRNDAGLGKLEGLLPLYVHAREIQHYLHYKDEDLLVMQTASGDKLESAVQAEKKNERFADDAVEILIKAISAYVTPSTLPRLPGIIRTAISKQRALFLLDGLDEIPPYQASSLTKFISSLLNKFPQLGMVVALSFENLAGLPTLGFSLLGMAAWGDDERASFLSRWSRMWVKFIYPFEKKQEKKINTQYLNSMLKVNNAALNPLEYVLKVWAAYSGDIRGSDGPSSIEAYILRMTSNETKARAKLEQFALQQLLDVGAISPIKEAELSDTDQEVDASNPLNPELASGTMAQSQPAPVKRSSTKVPGGIDAMIDSGFMLNYPGSHYGFSHPIFAGYLAGNALVTSESSNQILGIPASIGKTLALYYLAYFGDVTPFINNMIQEDDILHTNHLLISRWLQVAPKNRPWRSIVLRTLTSIIQKEKDTVSLAAKAVTAMALSGDKGVAVYFRQLIKSEFPTLKQLAALGCGILGDKKSIADLNDMLQEQSPGSLRAASLALAAIGDKQSLEILASCLLNGNEMLRRCAAEALANDTVEGYPALKDGSTLEDLMVRRAVAFGLIRVNLPWATKIVENMQLEDSEWVVRNAAIQAFDELKRKNSYAPKPIPDLTEAQWLIDYATRVGTTVAPGKPSQELVLKVLANGTQDEILNALDFLRRKCDPETMKYIFATYANNTGEIKDIAYYIMWLMLIAGIKLPLSIKYNIQ